MRLLSSAPALWWATGRLCRRWPPRRCQRRHASLYAAARRVAGARGDATLFAAAGDGGALSYAQFFSLVERTAATLRRHHGLSAGDRLLAQCHKGRDNLVVYLAALRLGAVYVPVSADCTPVETGHFVRDARPKLVVCDEALRPQLESSALSSDRQCSVLSECELFDRVAHDDRSRAASPAPTPPPATGADDVAIICYTSGTTGRPKGACITHGNLVSNARALIDAWRFTAADRLLHVLPLNHVHGLCVAVNTVMLSGASFYWMDAFSASAARDAFASASCSTLMAVPTVYKRLLDRRDWDAGCARGARLFVSGSAPLADRLWHEFAARTGGTRILERYGMTEGQMICSNPYEESLRRPGTVGLPLPGVQVRVDEPTGCIEYRGPNVFAGYWRMADKTAEQFTDDGWFKSADVAAFDQHGYVRIVGRRSDMIISGGLNVHPAEVERALDAHPMLAESCVVGAPHGDYGEAAIALCVLATAHAPHSDSVERELADHCRRSMAAYKVPKKFVFVDRLPRNHMGKLVKGAVSERYRHLLHF